MLIMGLWVKRWTLEANGSRIPEARWSHSVESDLPGPLPDPDNVRGRSRPVKQGFFAGARWSSGDRPLHAHCGPIFTQIGCKHGEQDGPSSVDGHPSRPRYGRPECTD